MDGVDIIAGILHADAGTLSFTWVEHRLGRHLVHGVGGSIDRPLIEPFHSGVLLLKEHVEHLIWLCGRSSRVAKVRVVPFDRRWRRYPLRFTLVARILHNNPHTVLPVVVGEIAHDPDSGT